MKKRLLYGCLALCLLFGAGNHLLASPRDRGLHFQVLGSVVYVDKDALVGGDGSSWATAFHSLQDALDCVRNSTYAHCTTPGELWVAAGVYYPDDGSSVAPDDPTESFYLIEGIALYGGFDGIDAGGMGGVQETALSQRDYGLNKTILSGDILQDDTDLDGDHIIESADDIYATNSANVVYGDASGLGGISSATILDGFYITAGDGVHGGGLICAGSSLTPCDPLFANLIFRGNRAISGGAMYLEDSHTYLLNLTFTGNASDFGGALRTQSSTYTLVNSIFRANSAEDGGAIYNNNSDGSTLTNVSFEENATTTLFFSDGGAIYNQDGSLGLTDVTFLANGTTGRGGGMYNFNSELDLTRVGFYGNSADEGGAIFDEMNSDASFASELTNVVFSGNTAGGDGGAMNVLVPAGAPTPSVDLHITNVTSNRNSAGNSGAGAGGALYFNGASINITITNSIFWHSTDSISGLNEMHILDSTVTMSYSDLKGAVGGVTTGGAAPGGTFIHNVPPGTNIDRVPHFVDFDGGDNVVGTFDDNLDLKAISPAIDSGLDSAITERYDFMGPPSVRERDGDGNGSEIVDMGAYEF